MPNYFQGSTNGSNTAGFSNPINGAYYAPGTVTQNTDPNTGHYLPFNSNPSNMGIPDNPAQSLGPVPQQNNFKNTGYGFNAQQLAATGNATPQSLGAASIQSSSPPYQPVVNQEDTRGIQNLMHGIATGTNGLTQGQSYNYTQIDPNWNNQQLNYNAIPLGGTIGTVQAQTNQATATQSAANQGSLTQANPNYGNTQASTYNPYVVNSAQGTVDPNSVYSADQAVAAQGQVDPRSLVQNQFTDINNNSPVDQNGVPLWARTAVTAAQQQMAALGLGSSTMAGNATAGAILNAEMPMAQQNAQTYAAINSQNLTQQQQTTLANLAASNTAKQFNSTVFAAINSQNLQNLQQTLLTNAGAINAAAQFNSQSVTQNNQFFAGLASDIAKFNASQANTMSSFNAAQANQVGEFNAQQANQISQFNAAQANTQSQFNAQQSNAIAQFLANMQNQREEFNAQNQLLVDQSNVQWQRAVNTANTAGINAANHANTQNLFNMSQSALNNEWQMIQDQASWALSAGENSQNRGLTLATSALNQQTALSILNSQLSAQTFSQLGSLASNLLGGSLGKSIGNGINSLFGGGGGGGYNASNYTGSFNNYLDSIGLGGYSFSGAFG